MRIAINLPALKAHRYYGVSQRNLEQALERLSSGYRINHAADDPAGLAIAVKFRYQLGGIVQAQTNVETGISMLQTTEGALQEILNIQEGMYGKAVAAANDTLTTTDRNNIQVEITQMIAEIDRISDTAQFNKLNPLKGEIDPATLHVGPYGGDTIEISIASTTSTILGIDGLSVTTQADAEAAIALVGESIETTTARLTEVGSYENRLEHASGFLSSSELGVTGALSAVQDADFAEEMVNYTRSQLLVEASAAMISQANLNPGRIMELLGITSGGLTA